MICLWQSPVRGQFMSEPGRVTTPEFVKFFHQRLHDWHSANVYKFADDVSLREFVRLNTSFGLTTPIGFYRSFGYGAVVNATTTKEHFVSLVNLSENSDIEKTIRNLANKFGVEYDKKFVGVKSVGVILYSAPNKISLQVYLPDLKVATHQLVEKNKLQGSGVLIFDYENKKLVRTRVLQPTKGTEASCGPAVDRGQADRILSDNSEQILWHVARAQGKAVGGKAEEYVEKFRTGMNLQPGLISCLPERNYEFVYP